MAAATETTTTDYSVPQTNSNIRPSAYGMATACNKFINSDGTLGEWGRALIDGIERVGTDCFYEDANFSVLCPKYKDFTPGRKKQFLAFLFASMAHYESSCRPNVSARGVNDLAVGLFQLENSWRQRRNAGRSVDHCSSNRPVNAYTIEFQMRCGASIFYDGYCRRNKTPGVNSWYWHKLNGNRGITIMAKKFPYCN